MIQLRVKNENDLYNPYDPSQTRINDDIYQYLKSCCSPLEASKHTNDTLQIITDSKIDSEKFERVLHNAVNRDLEEFDRQIARNNKRVIWELIVGVLLSALGVMLAIVLDKVLLAIISFFGSMCLKDAVAIQTTINHDLKGLKKMIMPMNEIRLEVVRQDA